MISNQVSATLSLEDREAVQAAIATIREKLPFLISLTMDERRTLVGLGGKTRSFIRKAVDVAGQTPRMLPVAFDLDEMRRDAQLLEDLSSIQFAVTQLQTQIDDTVKQVGHAAFADARTVYSCSKSSFGRGAFKTAAEELGQRFVRRGRPAVSTADAAIVTSPAPVSQS